MTDRPEAGSGATDGPPPGSGAVERERWRRRRRLDEVFGDVLPETTGDERDLDRGAGGSGEPAGEAGDRWLRDQVPPHHGD